MGIGIVFSNHKHLHLTKYGNHVLGSEFYHLKIFLLTFSSKMNVSLLLDTFYPVLEKLKRNNFILSADYLSEGGKKRKRKKVKRKKKKTLLFILPCAYLG